MRSWLMRAFIIYLGKLSSSLLWCAGIACASSGRKAEAPARIPSIHATGNWNRRGESRIKCRSWVGNAMRNRLMLMPPSYFYSVLITTSTFGTLQALGILQLSSAGRAEGDLFNFAINARSGSSYSTFATLLFSRFSRERCDNWRWYLRRRLHILHRHSFATLDLLSKKAWVADGLGYRYCSGNYLFSRIFGIC